MDDGQLNEHKTEPNSGLGKAMKYLLRHWHKLTLFLRQAGAPLDNNICELTLKMVVLLRKNALAFTWVAVLSKEPVIRDCFYALRILMRLYV